MGRRRKLVPVTMTTIGVSLQTLEEINKYKTTRENQDHFIKRLLIEWKSSREIIKDLELAEQYKDKRLEQYETEISRLRTLVENNPTIQELR